MGLGFHSVRGSLNREMTEKAAAGGEADRVLADLRREPFRVQRPDVQAVPFVFASPHSGRTYPESFVAQSRLSALSLRRSEDAFADELFAPVLSIGAPMISANFPRAFVDANRSPA